MNRLSNEARVQILAALCEGASINATARQTGRSHVTILKLLSDVGPLALDLQRKLFVNLSCTRIQCDEIWSFVQCKQAGFQVRTVTSRQVLHHLAPGRR